MFCSSKEDKIRAILVWLIIVFLASPGLIAQQPAATNPDSILTAQYTYVTCPICDGLHQLLCSFCGGRDLTKEICPFCNGRDLTKETCVFCEGRGWTSDGQCYWCGGTGHGSTCYWCGGSGHRSPCFYCGGQGFQTCSYCSSDGFVSVSVNKGEQTAFYAPFVAENGSYYGELNENGIPKTVYVRSYYRKDGTYVSSYYRSPPSTNPRYVIDLDKGPGVAENGSYYGEPSKITGNPKTIYIKGYFRKDGTYVRGHYRSKGK